MAGNLESIIVAPEDSSADAGTAEGPKNVCVRMGGVCCPEFSKSSRESSDVVEAGDIDAARCDEGLSSSSRLVNDLVDVLLCVLSAVDAAMTCNNMMSPIWFNVHGDVLITFPTTAASLPLPPPTAVAALVIP